MTFDSNATEQEIKDLHIKISDNVKKFRNENGMSQMELSLLIGFKNSAYIGACENNSDKKHFNIEQLYKIAKALNIAMEELIK